MWEAGVNKLATCLPLMKGEQGVLKSLACAVKLICEMFGTMLFRYNLKPLQYLYEER